ncbi:hypothetical protein [Terrisporobacter hibernicus]|uniref:Uncharacterized protein n=1 Tax=Terrisporobacter hibernicus TaxID=2813371 RepID=A0AAX2ZFW1_9FIRM|nr:hypothetical protein [Terrisporobacter hibernicus]UEL48122.1 hypothetical protein JW646_01345 [Terrisporobacter hibernicus]
MLADSIEIKVRKKDAMKHIFRKTPLISKIDQFNRKVDNIHLEYVEYKILKYEIISRRKNKNNFRNEDINDNITMMVNTYNGHSKSVESVPQTVKRYIARSCIKKSNIKEDYIVEKVKNEILNYFDSKIKKNSIDKHIIKNIRLLEVRSIYKPYWIGDYNGKEVFVDA